MICHLNKKIQLSNCIKTLNEFTILFVINPDLHPLLFVIIYTNNAESVILLTWY